MAVFSENGIQAWCSYNGSTNSIRDSYNCSVVADNGTGDFAKDVQDEALGPVNVGKLGLVFLLPGGDEGLRHRLNAIVEI